MGETFRYPPIYPRWTNAGNGNLKTTQQPMIRPVIPKEKAFQIISLFAKILGDISALDKTQGKKKKHTHTFKKYIYIIILIF